MSKSTKFVHALRSAFDVEVRPHCIGTAWLLKLETFIPVKDGQEYSMEKEPANRFSLGICAGKQYFILQAEASIYPIATAANCWSNGRYSHCNLHGCHRRRSY